jgi:hypothetical protein
LGGFGGFGGLSGLGFGPFGFFSAEGSGVGVGVATPGSGVGVGGGGAVGAGRGAGFGLGAALWVGADVEAVEFDVVEPGLVGAGFDAGAGGVVATGAGGRGSFESSRGERVVVGPSTLAGVSATGTAGIRATAMMKPPSGIDGAGAGGVASRPRTPPIAKPTKMPTIDWMDFDSIRRASRLTLG